jgi:hypothetical protein
MTNPGPNDAQPSTGWPALPLDEWAATRDSIQLWTQIVGKIRLAHSPLLNHWWNVPLYVTSRGLTTSLMWADDGRGFQIDFDFVAHRLRVTTSNGDERTVELAARSVADFYAELVRRLRELGIEPSIWTVPVELEGAIRFEEDETHAAYNPRYAERFWQLLVTTTQVFNQFRTTFVGKSSPVHLFWGALDLATTRFSGRAAPPHPGGAPNCGPHVMHEAYSQEVSSAGYWPGGAGEGVFYSYAYPEPPGYRDVPISPGAAHYDDALGEFVLPYEAVRTAADPAGVLLDFLQTTYDAAADRGGWDREQLERKPPPWTRDGVALPGPLLRPGRA